MAAFLQSGVAVVVATRNDDLRPEIGRGWGPQVAADGTAVALCVSVPPGSRTRENLRSNGAIAATFSRPSTYRTVQLKGDVLDVREPSEGELARVQAHLAAFLDDVQQIGVRPSDARALLERDLAAVTFEVRELFDQTPGPNAGTPL
jgi:hypothetical protein